jgi:hypothetical protein
MGAETANVAVTIMRGTTTDPYGDTQDDLQPFAQGVPATLVETAQVVFDPGSQIPRTVRAITCIVPSFIGVLDTDQIQVPAAGDTFMIEDVVTQPNLTGAPADVKLILRRVTGTGT